MLFWATSQALKHINGIDLEYVIAMKYYIKELGTVFMIYLLWNNHYEFANI